MCGETRIPRDMCAGNTLPGETYITVTPVTDFFMLDVRVRVRVRVWVRI